MATPTGGPADAFASYVALQTQALDIVREACSGREELVQRIADLELELNVWKDAQRKEVALRENALRALRALEDSESLAVCLIDGDACLFSRQLIARGRDGGRDAAQALQKHIAELASKTSTGNGKPTVICQVWFNKQGLSRVFQEMGIASDATFSAFIQGFNQAHPLFLMTDVGGLKEACDAKFRETLRMYARMMACKLLVLGCSSDGGYAHQLQSLKTEALDWKVHLIRSSEMAFAIKQLAIQEVEFEDLFERKKLIVSMPHTSSSSSSSSLMPTVAAGPSELKSSASTFGSAPKTPKKGTTAAASNATPSASTANNAGTGFIPVTTTKRVKDKASISDKENGFIKITGKLRAIDPKKPLSRQNPPPCNIFYLIGECTRGDSCPYAHDYHLSAQNIATLRIDAKKSACYTVTKGRPCTDPLCVAGHACPAGLACKFGSTCKFPASMHPNGKFIKKGTRSPESSGYDTESE
ncbi:BQ5605_C040g11894 [Microbotryum silenes-dioicae]|uniref:BQ5605_C040g11894 protein n=1 Tax=Microbotryum silenes-dioicae TaxID=796604 RepID=A0A2X0MTX2_9BASI|nr:BQ5605_C040g11894 [Microbotryum silenes-dioicae]